MFKKTQWFIIIFIAVGFLVIGYVLSYLQNNLPINSFGGVLSENTFQAGWNAAQKRTAENGFGVPVADVRTLDGTITEINGNTITLTIRPLEPLADISLDTRAVIITDKTKTYIVKIRDPKQYQAEIDAYKKLVEANPDLKIKTPLTPSMSTSIVPQTTVMPPQRLEKIEMSVNDLKVGQSINIFTDENIRDKKSFDVAEIDYYPISIENLHIPAALRTPIPVPPVPPVPPVVPTAPIK